MNDQSYFHWDLFRPPIHSPSFSVGSSFLDIRDEAMRGMSNKTKAFTFDQSCALWSKDMGLDPGEGLHTVGGRVLEVRKEKSRDAARSRRGKENYEFYELAKLLPLPAAITSQLDKASIIRLSISYLKLRDFCGHGDPPWPREGPPISKALKGAQRRRTSPGVAVELFELHQGAHILQSLDGFTFALSNDGRFLYISETVSIYLGLSQVEMAGSSIFDYVHTQDHQELADELGISLSGLNSSQGSPVTSPSDSPSAPRDVTPPLVDRLPTMSPNLDKGEDRCFCLRMKSTLTKRGVHNRSSGYRVVLILGKFRHQLHFGLPGRKSQAPLLGLAGTAIALPPPTITELRIEADTFIMRLTAKFKVIYCENMISTLTDWKSDDVTGKYLYTFCHPADVQLLHKVHTNLITKGQVLSPSIRLLNKHGGYIWVQMCATSLYTTKTSDDQTVLAIFQTISSIEHRDVVMDSSQLEVTEDGGEPASVSSVSQGITDDTATINGDFRQDSPSKSNSPDKPDIMSDNEPLLQSPGSIDTTSVFPDSVDNDFLLDDNPEDSLKCDTKTSRRKTDRPRKRRRESDDNVFSSPSSGDAATRMAKPVISERGGNLVQGNLPVNQGSLPNSPCELRAVGRSSPQLPEDLSYRPGIERPNFTSNCDGKETRCRSESDGATSSVKELEKIMNRHLSPRTGLATAHPDDHDFMHRNFSEPSKSSIQWAGSPQMSRDSLSASAFLRHLYTSRESVIRSNCRPVCYNGDVNSLSMLSLPNADTGKDQLHLNIPHISLQSKPQYPSQKESVSMLACPDDDFSMTPPSSVSPQDKVTSPFQESDVTGECLSSRFTNSGNISMVHGKNAFDVISENNNSDINRTNFLHLPNYQYPGTEGIQFAQNPSAQNGVIYESRAQNHGLWFGSAYTS